MTKIYLTEQEKKGIEEFVNGLEIDIDYTFSKDENGDLTDYGIEQYFQAQKDEAIRLLNPENEYIDYLYEYVEDAGERYIDLNDKSNKEHNNLVALNKLAIKYIENLNLN